MIERMSEEIMQALFETIPMEITVIDANDEVIAWNQHETRLFTRPLTSMGLNFRQCHPQRSLDKVERIVNEMREGTRDMCRFWIDLPIGPEGKLHKILIEFYALRDANKKYLGCMECTRDIQEIRELQDQKRLLD